MGQEGENKPLAELLENLKEAQRDFREKLALHGPRHAGENRAKEIRQSIMLLYPDFYPKLKDIEIAEAIEFLKTEGYKVLKRVEKIEYEET